MTTNVLPLDLKEEKKLGKPKREKKLGDGARHSLDIRGFGGERFKNVSHRPRVAGMTRGRGRSRRRTRSRSRKQK